MYRDQTSDFVQTKAHISAYTGTAGSGGQAPHLFGAPTPPPVVRRAFLENGPKSKSERGERCSMLEEEEARAKDSDGNAAD